jgi:hypothetical protein
MMTPLIARTLCLVTTLGAFVAAAQTDDQLNRFGLSYRMGLNVQASFINHGAPGLPGGPSVTGLSYSDGFVRPNSQPNDLNLSWNWGYQSSKQVVGDNIVMTSSQAGTYSSGKDDAPYNGVELSYNRRFGLWGKWRWGLEAAVNYTSISIHDNSTPAASVLTADAFSLGGSVPPATVPYAGTPDGPGVLISETPTRALMKINSSLDTRLLGFRFGPYFELPIDNKWAMAFSGGLALGWADSDFNYSQTVTVDGVSSTTQSASGSKSELLPGWYVSGLVSYKLSEKIGVFGGVQFQGLSDQHVQAGDKEVKLDLSKSIFINVGLSFSF